jgi:hypothetical protein
MELGESEMLAEILTITRANRDDLQTLMRAHNEMVAKVNGIIAELSPHLEQVGPMLDTIQNSSMMRMMFGTGKAKK